MAWTQPGSGAGTPMAVTAPDTAAPVVNNLAHAPVVPGATLPPAGGPNASLPPPPVSKRPADSASESNDDDKPLVKRAKPTQAPTSRNGAQAGPSKTKPSSKRAAAPASSDLSESDDDDKPLAKSRAPANGRGGPKAKKNAASSSDDDNEESELSESDDDKPLVKAKRASTGSRPAAKAKPRASTSKRSKAASTDSSEDSENEDEPLAKKGKKANGKKAPASKSNGTKAAPVRVKKEIKEEPSSDEDDAPLAKKTPAKAAPARGKGKGKAVKTEDVKVKKERKVKEEEEDEDEKVRAGSYPQSYGLNHLAFGNADNRQYKWWEQGENDGSSKWTTLVHNGVLFPPPYVHLPKHVKMKYDGKSLTLPPESEEVAGFFAAMMETDHAKDATFRKNFFRDFQDVLDQFPPKEGIKVNDLEKCDFRPMFEHFESEKEKKKAMSKDEKKAIKDAREELEKPYLFALVDGRKEKLGNFRAEPPGLFRGRGEHPRKGTLKKRLRPEDIILNIGQDAPVPVPNIPGQWMGVQHDNTVTWLAHWKENVNGQAKYVFLAAGSSWKGQSDRAKFEKARELIKHVDKIRKDYTEDLKSKVMADRQRATALYFIDKLALRAGNEKGEEEADTVGCCSLRYEHVTLEPPNKVIFDFLGKDSMRFHQEVEVEAQVFKNIKIFKMEKQKGDDLFDRLTTVLLNKYLNDQMKGLTAKVFRTYNASWTFQNQLRKLTPKNGTVQEKIAAYNDANRDVAILCNHQKTVSKGFEQSFAKMGDKVRALKYQRMKLRYQLFVLDPKAKKRHPELKEDESDMDDDFIERHEADMLEKALSSAEKKWERDNVKAENGGDEEKKPLSWLKDRKKEIEAEFKELRKERKTKHVEPRKGATEEKLVEQIAKMDERIVAAKVQMGDREKTKDVALGTSKINYIDPRITVAWARKFDVPLEKLFSKALREKFPWAEAEAEANWTF